MFYLQSPQVQYALKENCVLLIIGAAGGVLGVLSRIIVNREYSTLCGVISIKGIHYSVHCEQLATQLCPEVGVVIYNIVCPPVTYNVGPI